MSFVSDELPIVFDKLLEEMEKNDGEMTADEFKQFLYNLRFTEDDLKNITKKFKKYLFKTRFNKKDAMDFKRWLNLNGYIIINHRFQKEIIVLNGK